MISDTFFISIQMVFFLIQDGIISNFPNSRDESVFERSNRSINLDHQLVQDVSGLKTFGICSKRKPDFISLKTLPRKRLDLYSSEQITHAELYAQKLALNTAAFTMSKVAVLHYLHVRRGRRHLQLLIDNKICRNKNS